MLLVLVVLWAGAGVHKQAKPVDTSHTLYSEQYKGRHHMLSCEKRVTTKVREIFEKREDPNDMPILLENWCDHLGHRAFFKLSNNHSPGKQLSSIWRKGSDPVKTRIEPPISVV